MNDNGEPSADFPIGMPAGRWRPMRSGLLNFYRYDDQEFHFHQGRLLLRGNNGTGKSRVLALQLPFLLDGEISPERVEPDCDRAKRFEWNLLMGRHPDRLGYTWIEFGRRDNEGTPHFLTLGCGVRAVAARGLVGKWFFVTTRRVGHDLSLCSAQHNPLPKEPLTEALADRGTVFVTAAAYREEVNRRLYGLSQERYEALVKLLIELRQPKLSSRHLDEKMLSNVMSDALMPARAEMIHQVSDAMRAMDQDRVALSNLESARKSTELFLVAYRQYAQMIACRRSDAVLASHRTYEDRQRKLRNAENEHSTAVEDEKRLRARGEQLSVDLAAAQGRRSAFESSPEMRSARDLESARKHAAERRTDANRSAEQLSASIDALNRATADQAAEFGQLHRASKQLVVRLKSSDAGAVACALDPAHRAAVARAQLPEPHDVASVDAAEKLLRRSWDERQRDIRLLRELNTAVDASRQAWRHALDRRDAQAGRVAESSIRCRSTVEAVALALGAMSSAYFDWHASLIQLVATPPEEVGTAIVEWGETDTASPSPVACSVAEADGTLKQGTAAERAARLAERREFLGTLESLTEERHRLLEGRHEPPPVSYTRDPHSRADRPGAPLWRLSARGGTRVPSRGGG